MKPTRITWSLAGVLTLSLLVLAGCSTDGRDGKDGRDGASVIQNDPNRTVIVHDR